MAGAEGEHIAAHGIEFSFGHLYDMSPAFDPEFINPVAGLVGQQFMALLIAKMRHVDCGHGVSCNHFQHRTGGQAQQLLAGLENRQGTQQVRYIKYGFRPGFWVVGHVAIV